MLLNYYENYAMKYVYTLDKEEIKQFVVQVFCLVFVFVCVLASQAYNW